MNSLLLRTWSGLGFVLERDSRGVDQFTYVIVHLGFSVSPAKGGDVKFITTARQSRCAAVVASEHERSSSRLLRVRQYEFGSKVQYRVTQRCSAGVALVWGRW